MAKKSMKNWFGLGKKDAISTDEDKVNPELLVSSDDETAEEKAIRRAADLRLFTDFENNNTASEVGNVVAEPEVITPEPTTLDAVTDVVEEDVTTKSVNQESVSTAIVDAISDEPVADEPVNKDKFLTRLKRGLSRTKGNIGSGFKNFFRGKHIDDELFEELEEQLLIADLGVATTTRIIDNLTQQASRKDLKDAEALYDILKKDMAELLHKVDQPLVIDSNNKPHVILMVGVNGVGKTTTIGKMAKKFQGEGKSVMLAAGDTFRAAAVEQLQVWGDRNGIPVVAQHTGADSASVLFDAMQSATAKDVDVLIADTAGRLQNKAHLMEELKKVVRVMRKHDATAPHEIMLTIDAGTGQNALSQAELFKEAVGLTGITITKLDGTAKGGVIFAVADKFEIPIRFIGIGEGIDDLRTFNSEEFIEALFSNDEQK
ncbi:MAG: fused signal recognition particle receptor [Moritella dasanensis]|jgi:fused signal recognition particle receptor